MNYVPHAIRIDVSTPSIPNENRRITMLAYQTINAVDTIRPLYQSLQLTVETVKTAREIVLTVYDANRNIWQILTFYRPIEETVSIELQTAK